MPNENVLKRAGMSIEFMRVEKERQLKFCGHVMRTGDIENLTVNGKIERKRTPDRQLYKLSDNIS